MCACSTRSRHICTKRARRLRGVVSNASLTIRPVGRGKIGNASEMPLPTLPHGQACALQFEVSQYAAEKELRDSMSLEAWITAVRKQEGNRH